MIAVRKVPPRVILHSRRHGNGKGRCLREGTGKGYGIDKVVLYLPSLSLKLWLVEGVSRPSEHDLVRIFSRDGGRELEGHGKEGNTVGIGIFALAGKLCGKWRPHAIRKLLILGRGNAAQGLYPLTPDEVYLHAIRKTLFALDDDLKKFFFLFAPVQSPNRL